ncbi:MAG: type II toxin-antitoxin system VapC family toxin [Solirubrobacterales bacterium]|nr:type II toxin-antitoxin system VapC family toxin [Solirubrobacterales bacterium]
MTRDEEGILDTSAVILLGKIDPALLPELPRITTLTLAELAVGPPVAKDETERLARQARLLQAEADFDPIPFDDLAARTFGSVAANLRQMGRKTSARTFDSLIAAVAVSRGLPLYTANLRDFDGIESLALRQV